MKSGVQNSTSAGAPLSSDPFRDNNPMAQAPNQQDQLAKANNAMKSLLGNPPATFPSPYTTMPHVQVQGPPAEATTPQAGPKGPAAPTAESFLPYAQRAASSAAEMLPSFDNPAQNAATRGLLGGPPTGALGTGNDVISVLKHPGVMRDALLLQHPQLRKLFGNG